MATFWLIIVVIELHAQFLELNFLSQIRVIPNITYNAKGNFNHPLTLHLSPTSHVGVVATSITPLPPSTSKFVLIAPDAEVIVTPKARKQSELLGDRENESAYSTGRPSTSGKSAQSSSRPKGEHANARQKPVFTRLVDRSIAGQWFSKDKNDEDRGIKVWLDREILSNKVFRSTKQVAISIVKPLGLGLPSANQSNLDDNKPSSIIVANVGVWRKAPNKSHACLSSLLCQTLGYVQVTGEVARIEAAPQAGIRNSGSGDRFIPKSVYIYPFSVTKSTKKSAFSIGQQKIRRDKSLLLVREKFQHLADQHDILQGPLTHGMYLPFAERNGTGWPGGILRFKGASNNLSSPEAQPLWISDVERHIEVDFEAELPSQPYTAADWQIGEYIEKPLQPIIGAEELFSQLSSLLSHNSSVLLTGGLGIGKTTLARTLAYWHCKEYLASVIYLRCRTISAEELRVANIKNAIRRVFASAIWRTRFGGRSLVVLDDLDWLCPAENELQVGNDNARGAQVAETVRAAVRECCSIHSRLVLLATAQSKDALHQLIIGGHVFHEIAPIKVPDKENRRKILKHLLCSRVCSNSSIPFKFGPDLSTRNATDPKHSDVLGEIRSCEATKQFLIGNDVDFLDIAGRCDGYMPGDLKLIALRARNEATIRSIHDFPEANPGVTLTILSKDISKAIQNFVPASLRNISLQKSTVHWEDIGGLRATRQILLETLQYPTTYAAIFANCPLRLRSGLLLYGYPGCGKTLLASAVASECGLNFISVRGPEILNKYIGASEKAIRDLFERAESAKPCILFFDEFDSIAPKRGHDSTGVTDRVVNQLLTQMDGAEGLSGVYVLAATSRPDLIDPALLRPGRLDKSVLCGMPNLDDRIDILEALCKKVKLDRSMLVDGIEDVSRKHNVKHSMLGIALRTEGFSGADLQAMIYNAQLAAIHQTIDADQPDKKVDDGLVNDFTELKDEKICDLSLKNTFHFSHFRYGPAGEGKDRNSKTLSEPRTAERFNIAAQLEALHVKSKQRKTNKINSDSIVMGIKRRENSESLCGEPTIRWQHVEDALETTKPSIADSERRRLQQIYHEFIVGRNGDLPSGQGGNEIGGRMSLM